MAAEQVIGKLVFQFTGDIAGLLKAQKDTEKSLESVEGRMTRLGDIAKKTGLILGAAFVAAGTAIGLAVKGAINDADKMGKAAESIGIPVEQLSALKHAADLSDVSLDELTGGLTRLTRSMVEATADGTDPASRALNALGIASRDSSGQLRSSNDVLLDVAAKFANMENGAGKTALAIDLFGKSGAQLIPLLNSGAVGLGEMADEAARMGLIIDSNTAQAAQAFNDTLTRMGGAFEGVFMQLASKVLPTLNALADRMLSNTTSSGTLSAALDVLVGAFKAVLSAGALVHATFSIIGQTISAVASAVLAAAQGEFTLAFNVIKAAQANMVATATEDLGFVQSLWNDWATTTTLAADTMATKVAPPIIASTKAMADANKEADEANREWVETLDRAGRVMQSLETPQETQKRKMQELVELYAKGALTSAEFQMAQQRMAVGGMENWNQLAGIVGSSLTTIFGNNKAAAIGEAIINTYLAVTKTMASLPWPFNIAAAAAQAAAGMAQVAEIRSTNIQAREFGGPVSAGQPYLVGEKRPEIFVPNTSGTIVPRVGSTGASGGVLTIPSIRPKDFFTGDTVRYMAEALVKHQRNGGQVVFA